jgi:hypothetical protein
MVSGDLADNFPQKRNKFSSACKGYRRHPKTAWFMLQRIRACFGIENHNELKEL